MPGDYRFGVIIGGDAVAALASDTIEVAEMPDSLFEVSGDVVFASDDARRTFMDAAYRNMVVAAVLEKNDYLEVGGFWDVASVLESPPAGRPRARFSLVNRIPELD